MQLKKVNDGMSDIPDMEPLPDFAAPAAAPSGGMAKVATCIALVCTLASIAMLGLVAWMVWSNLEFIKDV